MERRQFLKAMLANGALAAAPIPALAGEAAARPVLLVCQGDAPGAARLAEAIAFCSASAGMPVERLELSGSELRRPDRIEAVLERAHVARIVGVMDDAAAVIFEALAAARGAAWLLQAQHRVGSAGASHRYRLSGLGQPIAWSESEAAWEGQAARLHAGILAGRLPQRLEIAKLATGPASAHSLVSFALAA